MVTMRFQDRRRALSVLASLTSLAGLAATLPACSTEAVAVVTTYATTTTTTTGSTTTQLSTTSSSSTTTTEPLPIPQAIPADGTEPYLELGTIEIPKITLTAPLLEGVTDSTLDDGPGHWPGTAMPGRTGNVVVGGHRTSHTHPFRHIDQLVPGDEVIFTTAEGRFVYLVDRTEIVTPQDVWIVNQTTERTATLFACHPLGSTSHRMVVFLKLRP
jgi:sortase A